MILPVLRIRDVYPGSQILIFTHPGSRIQKEQQKRWVTKNLLSYFFVATNIKKSNFIFEMLKKKFGSVFKELLKFLCVFEPKG
jgi:hypothetical protein